MDPMLAQAATHPRTQLAALLFLVLAAKLPETPSLSDWLLGHARSAVLLTLALRGERIMNVKAQCASYGFET